MPPSPKIPRTVRGGHRGVPAAGRHQGWLQYYSLRCAHPYPRQFLREALLTLVGEAKSMNPSVLVSCPENIWFLRITYESRSEAEQRISRFILQKVYHIAVIFLLKTSYINFAYVGIFLVAY